MPIGIDSILHAFGICKLNSQRHIKEVLKHFRERFRWALTTKIFEFYRNFDNEKRRLMLVNSEVPRIHDIKVAIKHLWFDYIFRWIMPHITVARLILWKAIFENFASTPIPFIGIALRTWMCWHSSWTAFSMKQNDWKPYLLVKDLFNDITHWISNFFYSQNVTCVWKDFRCLNKAPGKKFQSP